MEHLDSRPLVNTHGMATRYALKSKDSVQTFRNDDVEVSLYWNERCAKQDQFNVAICHKGNWTIDHFEKYVDALGFYIDFINGLYSNNSN